METRLQRWPFPRDHRLRISHATLWISRDAKIVDGLFSIVANQIESSMAIPYLLTSILEKKPHQRRKNFSLWKHILPICHSHYARALLCEGWYWAIPIHSWNSYGVNVVYITAKCAAITCDSSISCGKYKNRSLAMAALKMKREDGYF